MWRSWKTGRLPVAMGVLCAFALAGCSSVPRSGIDPTGERIFAAPAAPAASDRSNERYWDQPMGQVRWDDVDVTLEPLESVAPVGSEVVLVAGVCGSDGYLRMNRRLEWSIDPGSVGQFVDVGKTGWVDYLLGDFNRPRKITNIYAIGSTLRANVSLNRGTCSPDDDVYVLRGQGWISLTSPIEGTSHVNVVAPEVYGWNARMKTATVHWVDAQWQFPPPAINPAGTKHVFTTTVTRQSNQSPCERWLVRYEIVDGPPAGFMPDGATAIEVPTNSSGQANAEIFQKEPRHGVNQVRIQVIRPGDIPGAGGKRLVVGSGTTTKTWTGADLGVKITAPATVNPGNPISYRINVSNPGDLAAKDVVVSMTPVDGLALLNSNPQAESAGRQFQWRLGELGARQQRTIDVQCRADKQGSIMQCCEVAAAGGLKVTDCATTTVGAASLEVRVTGPSQAAVGSQAAFEITVRNLSGTPAKGLIIKDRLEPGLEHPQVNENNAIERLLGDLAAGASQRISVTLQVTKPGRLCHTVEVSGPGVAPASAQACVQAGSAGGESAATPQPDQPASPSIGVKVDGPQQLKVGETAQFSIEVRNLGTTDLRNLRVLDLFGAELEPTLATDGWRFEEGGLAWSIDSLPAGRATKLGVHCKCLSPAAQVCNRVVVTTPDGGKSEGQACLEILAADAQPSATPPETGPPADGLKLSAVGLHNPVMAGKELTYEIRVTNDTTSPCQQATVTAAVPEGMALSPLGTVGPNSLKFKIEGRVVRFEPLAEIPPGASAVYRIRVRTKQAGDYRFRAELSVPGLPQPLVQEAKTEVF